MVTSGQLGVCLSCVCVCTGQIIKECYVVGNWKRGEKQLLTLLLQLQQHYSSASFCP